MTSDLSLPPNPFSLPGLPASSCTGRILIAEAWNVSPHLETGMEIAIRLAAAGYKIDYLFYGHVLSYVEFCNTQGLPSLVKKLFPFPLGQHQRGISLLKTVASLHELDIRVLSRPQVLKVKKFFIPKQFLASIDALKSFVWNGSSYIGLSVASSFVTLKNSSQALPKDDAELCFLLGASFIESYLLLEGLVKNQEYSALIVFNGRFPCVKGAVTASKKSDLPVFFHERGATKDHFSLRSFQPHNRLCLQKEIISLWFSSTGTASRFRVASSFFEKLRAGSEVGWINFSRYQEPGIGNALIERARNSSQRKKLVVYFSSCDDEYFATDDVYETSTFEWSNQYQALQALAEVVKAQGLGLIIRVHPYLEKKPKVDRDVWNELSFLVSTDGIYIVESGFNFSSYELLEAADVVVTHGSTVGIESVYWNKPSILLGDSDYDEIGASCYKPFTKAQLCNLLEDIDSLVVDPSSALPYGYYMSTFGYLFQYYRAANLFSGSFAGQNLASFPPLSHHRLLASFIKSIFAFLKFFVNFVPLSK